MVGLMTKPLRLCGERSFAHCGPTGATGTKGSTTMRRKTLAAVFAVCALGLSAAPALGDPSFGPGAGQGQGNNAPHENPGTKCHPPGQTADRPECK